MFVVLLIHGGIMIDGSPISSYTRALSVGTLQIMRGFRKMRVTDDKACLYREIPDWRRCCGSGYESEGEVRMYRV